MEMGAIFDPTGAYRYTLWRRWCPEAPGVTFILLNPSRADAHTNDPTLRRCIQFAQHWGFGYLAVVNLFALVTPHPQELQHSPDPVGAECDRHLLAALQTSEKIVLGWGNWGWLHQRDRAVLELLRPQKHLYCLGMNQSGQPRHPLYIPVQAPLVQYPKI